MANEILDPGVPPDEVQPVERDQDFGMIHMNGHLLCAVDVETTGLTAGEHDIVEIAIVPLNHLLQPNKKYKPFHMRLIPKREDTIQPRALAKCGFTLAELKTGGFDPWKAADMLEEWLDRLKLPIRHNIVPLAHNWPFDREFIKEWCGPKTFEYVFNGHYRDTMALASFLNDRAYDKGEKPPFPRLGLDAMCNRMGVENKMPHRALYDCLATAELYRKLVTSYQL